MYEWVNSSRYIYNELYLLFMMDYYYNGFSAIDSWTGGGGMSAIFSNQHVFASQKEVINYDF